MDGQSLVYTYFTDGKITLLIGPNTLFNFSPRKRENTFSSPNTQHFSIFDNICSGNQLGTITDVNFCSFLYLFFFSSSTG